MKKEKPFKVGFLPDRWEGGIAGLSHDAEYIYFRLSLRMMATGCGVPEEDGPAVCRFFKRYRPALTELMRKEKVRIVNGEILIERALLEHRLAVEEAERAKRRGEAGAAARWNAQALPKDVPKQSASTAQAIAPLPPKKKPTLVGSEPVASSETRTLLARGLRPLAACLPGAGAGETDPQQDDESLLDIPDFLRRPATA